MPTYVPPTTGVLLDIDGARSVQHAPTVPLRVPLSERRFTARVFAAVLVVAFVVGGVIGWHLVATGQVG